MAAKEKGLLIPAWVASIGVSIGFGWVTAGWQDQNAAQRTTAAHVTTVGAKLDLATTEIKGSLATLETAVRFQMQDHSRRIENLERDRDRRAGWPSSAAAAARDM